jgi:hypothetical protein
MDKMKTLENFPEDFSPLVIITGDRREIPPQSKGDLLAYSVSNTDFMYLPQIGIRKSLVLTDKQFRTETQEKLKKRFGKTNILIIGSPAVNLFAREINDLSLFRFSITEETKFELKEQDELMNSTIDVEDEFDLFIYHQCLEGIVDADTILNRFKGHPSYTRIYDRATIIIPKFLETSIGKNLKTHSRPIRYLMHKLDKPGIEDSIDNTIRGAAIPQNKDYGLISLLHNPFSDEEDYYIIYVAGVHGPGTAKGLELLTIKSAFSEHPFGGIFDVRISRFTDYYEKFQSSTVNWETQSYKDKDISKLQQMLNRQLTAFISSPSPKDDNKQKSFNSDLKKLLIEIFENDGYKLNIEGPYTLGTGFKIDFWDPILEYEQSCDFIIHDMTNLARGVLVEVGFSIGSKKPYFMIWNMDKAPDIEWDNLPELNSNVEPIKLGSNESTKLVKEKILKKVISKTFHSECESCQEIKSINKNNKSAFVYHQNEELYRFIDKQLSSRKITVISKNDFVSTNKICGMCKALNTAEFVFIEIANSDPLSYVLLGMSKSLKLRTQPISVERINHHNIPWAKEILNYNTDNIENRLNIKVTKFIDECINQ